MRVNAIVKRSLPLLCAALLMVAAGSAAVKGNPQLREYRQRVVGKQALAGSAAGAGFAHLRNSPHEWGRGVGGFAKRVGSSVGQHAVKGGIELGVGALHHENLHYQRSNLHGTLPRMKYAVKSTFIVPRTNRPGKTVALGRVSGNVGAGLISRAWQPASAAGVGAGLASGGIGLGADVGVHVAREFWPRKKAVVQRRAIPARIARR
jgi:hypothetical protein